MTKLNTRRVYKTPSRRRLNKWRTRTERAIQRAGARGPSWYFRELSRIQPLQDAADRAGVNLSLPPRRRFKSASWSQSSPWFLFMAAMERATAAFRVFNDAIQPFINPALGEPYADQENEGQQVSGHREDCGSSQAEDAQAEEKVKVSVMDPAQ